MSTELTPPTSAELAPAVVPDAETCDRFERCETCAFRPGTEANGSVLTRLKARLCAEAGEPFYCHEPIEDLTREGMIFSAAYVTLQEAGELQLCGGYVRLVDSLQRAGFYERDEEWRRRTRRGLLSLIERAEQDPTFEVTQEAFAAAMREEGLDA